MGFSRDRRSATAPQYQKLALDPQQLGNCAPSSGALGPFEPLVDRRKPAGDLACAAKGFCQNRGIEGAVTHY
jgi:hypothetical protein